MKPLHPARLVVATVIFCAAFFSTPVVAHAQLPQLIPQAAIENAEMLLPDAPMPQVSDAAASATGQATTPPAPATSSSSAQRTAPAPDPPAPLDPAAAAADAKKKQHDQAERDLKVQEKQRLLGVMPQFQVVMGGQAVPSIRRAEMEACAAHCAIDPFYIGWAFVIGGGYGELVGQQQRLWLGTRTATSSGLAPTTRTM